jgi:two-component system, NarL family, nitrate/nitrite response regulator NarL
MAMLNASGSSRPPFVNGMPHDERLWSARGFDGRGPVTVLVVHPNELMRRGIGAMASDIEVCVAATEAITYAEASNRIHNGPFHVLILPCQPREASRELAAEAVAAGVKVLLLLDDTDPDHLALAAELKADGFLLGSDLTAGSLQSAITSLKDGDMPVPPSLVKELVVALRSRFPAGRAPHRPLLTPREQQTLELLAQGLSNKQIARTLAIREHGAKRHVANVLAKLNCPNRTMAVAQALRDGLIQPSDAPG